MKLYKYVTSDRIDILTKGEIRFTQPFAWNDPFELKPFYQDHKPKNIWKQFSSVAKKYEQIDKLDTITEAKFKEYEKEVSNFEKERKRITKDEIYNYINRNILGLSLTEDKDNLLMWSHYSSEHSGFVIEFDTDNDFFKNNNRYLFKVTCNHNRPIVKTEEFATLISGVYSSLGEHKKLSQKDYKKISEIFRKSIEWEYEKEWRLLTTVDKAKNFKKIKKDINVIKLGNSGINDTDYCTDYVALFNIHPSCIKGIYCGKRMKTKEVRKLYFLIKYNASFSHIKLQCSEIDDKYYKLNYRDVTKYDVLNLGELSYEKENKTDKKFSMNPYLSKYLKEKKHYSKIKPASNKG